MIDIDNNEVVMKFRTLVALPLLVLGGSSALAAEPTPTSGSPTPEESNKAARTEGTTSANVLANVFFASDSAQIRADATEMLAPVVAYVNAHPDHTIVIDGHADPRGTAAYNVGLSSRRAEAVRDQLVAMGVDRGRVVLALWGEDGPRQESFAKDRRVSISTTPEPLYSIVDRALGPTDATALVWDEPVSLAELEGSNEIVAIR